jgi:hypothetical protein
MKLFLFLICFTFSSISFAVDIASCSNPIGKAYYPEIGLVTKEKSGWEQNEKITNGIVKLSKTAKEEYDILFVDSTKQITSSVEDGGSVLMLNRGKNVVSFMVIYPGTAAEIFTFLKNSSGGLEYIHVTSRAGDAVMITKASIMRGDCAFIEFSKV